MLFKVSIYRALETALERGDTTRAGELLASLAPLKPGQRTPRLRAIQAEFQARLGALLGDGDVEAQFTAAEALYRDLQGPFRTARVELEHAEWLLAQGRADQAQPLLATAHETFERLQAKPRLQRLETAETSSLFGPVSVGETKSAVFGPPGCPALELLAARPATTTATRMLSVAALGFHLIPSPPYSLADAT